MSANTILSRCTCVPFHLLESFYSQPRRRNLEGGPRTRARFPRRGVAWRIVALRGASAWRLGLPWSCVAQLPNPLT